MFVAKTLRYIIWTTHQLSVQTHCVFIIFPNHYPDPFTSLISIHGLCNECQMFQLDTKSYFLEQTLAIMGLVIASDYLCQYVESISRSSCILQTALYKEDWIGLRALDEAGKVSFINFAGDHLSISDYQMQEFIVPYLRPPEKTVGNITRPRPLADLWHATMWAYLDQCEGDLGLEGRYAK